MLRQELKFYLTAPAALLLQRRLFSVMKPDSHAFRGGYGVRSLYFDDSASSAYFDKVNGIEKRAKYRIRFYNGSPDFIRLEKKEKIGQKCRKTSQVISPELGRSLLLPTFENPLPDSILLSEMEHLIRHRAFRPRFFIDYDRKAFFYPAGNVRITLDQNLFASRFGGDLEEGTAPHLPGLSEGEVILEVKYDSFLPPFLAELLSDIPRIHSSVSKFAIGRELLF